MQLRRVVEWALCAREMFDKSGGEKTLKSCVEKARENFPNNGNDLITMPSQIVCIYLAERWPLHLSKWSGGTLTREQEQALISERFDEKGMPRV